MTTETDQLASLVARTTLLLDAFEQQRVTVDARIAAATLIAQNAALIAAQGLATSTAPVSIVASNAPALGNILTATSPTSATWQAPLQIGTLFYENNLSTPSQIPQGGAMVASGLYLTAAAGTYKVDASIQYSSFPSLVSSQCATDLNSLITQLSGYPSQSSHAEEYGNGEVLTPGAYSVVNATTHVGNLVYDAQGNPDAVFILLCGAAHAIAASASSTLLNGAQACNIFWHVTAALTLGANCNLKGTYIGHSDLAPGAGLNLDGRLLTSSGAIAMSTTTYATPSGKSLYINLGLLKGFAFFTTAGAISNTMINGGSGDVCTGSGAVTGFNNIKGNLYLPADSTSKVYFTLYQNGVPISTTSRSYEHRLYQTFEQVNLTGNAVVGSFQPISVVVKVDVGSVVLGNRSIYAQKLS